MDARKNRRLRKLARAHQWPGPKWTSRTHFAGRRELFRQRRGIGGSRRFGAFRPAGSTRRESSEQVASAGKTQLGKISDYRSNRSGEIGRAQRRRRTIAI